MFEDGWGELLPPPQHLLALPFDEEAVEEDVALRALEDSENEAVVDPCRGLHE